MDKILFFARDPAGANVIIPVVKEMRRLNKYRIVVYAKDFALERIVNEGIDVIDICSICENITYDFIYSFLLKENPGGVITGTSLNDFTERFFWRASSLLDIYSCAIMDQWVNFGIRFSQYDYNGEEEYKLNHRHPYLPTRIIVIDEYIKECMIRERIPEQMIRACGSPYFDMIKVKYNNVSQKSRNHETPKRILFASEPVSIDYDMYWGFTEKTIFHALYSGVLKACDELSIMAEIIIRPHPREGSDNWNGIMEQCRDDRVSIVINDKTDSFELMKSVDVVCGMSSMFLIESAICNVPIISILIGLLHESPFIFDRIGICKSKMNEMELYSELKKLLLGCKQSIPFNFKENATVSTISCIEEDLNNEYIGN